MFLPVSWAATLATSLGACVANESSDTRNEERAALAKLTIVVDPPQKGKLLEEKESGYDRFGFNESFKSKPKNDRDTFGFTGSFRPKATNDDWFGFNDSFCPGIEGTSASTASRRTNYSHDRSDACRSARPDKLPKRIHRKPTRTRYGFGAPMACEVIPDGHVFHRQADLVVDVEGGH